MIAFGTARISVTHTDLTDSPSRGYRPGLRRIDVHAVESR